MTLASFPSPCFFVTMLRFGYAIFIRNFINIDIVSWNVDLMSDTFNPIEAKIILNMPIKPCCLNSLI